MWSLRPRHSSTRAVFGAVIWVEAGECGIAFDRPLAPDEEQVLRQKLAETHGLPPDIKAAYDSWVVGCAR